MLSLPVHLNIITLSGEKVLKAVIFLTLKIRHVYIVILYIPADKRLRQRGACYYFSELKCTCMQKHLKCHTPRCRGVKPVYKRFFLPLNKNLRNENTKLNCSYTYKQNLSKKRWLFELYREHVANAND